jgi:hypothetical protein
VASWLAVVGFALRLSHLGGVFQVDGDHCVTCWYWDGFDYCSCFRLLSTLANDESSLASVCGIAVV